MHVLAGTFRRDRHGAANAPTVNAKQRKADALREYDHVAAIVAELHRMVVSPEDRGVQPLGGVLKEYRQQVGLLMALGAMLDRIEAAEPRARPTQPGGTSSSRSPRGSARPARRP